MAYKHILRGKEVICDGSTNEIRILPGKDARLSGTGNAHRPAKAFSPHDWQGTPFGWWCRLRGKLRETKGQGTTEYAILVGVLVVIAILAITVFRPKIEELWQAIADGINGL